MRLWVSGPRIGIFRLGLSVPLRGRRARAWTDAPAGPTGDFVYVIRCGDNLVKIGRSTNPAARLATLQTGSGFPMALAYVAGCDRAFEVEQETHTILARHRCQGEWFDCSEDAAVAAIHAAGYRLGATMILDQPVNVRDTRRELRILLVLIAAVVGTWWVLKHILALLLG